MLYRGCVVEEKQNSYIVLTSDHDFIKLKKNCKTKVGKEIYFLDEDVVREKSANYQQLKYIAASVLFLLLSLAMVLSLQGNVAVAMINVQINPKVSLTIDEQFKVVDLKALNEDGKHVISDDMKGQNYADVLEIIMFNAKEQKYLNEDHHTVFIEKESLNGYEISDEKIKQDIKEKLTASDKMVAIDFDVAYVKREEVEAEERNNSTSKTEINKEPKESKETKKPEEVEYIIKNHKESEKQPEKQNKPTKPEKEENKPEKENINGDKKPIKPEDNKEKPNKQDKPEKQEKPLKENGKPVKEEHKTEEIQKDKGHSEKDNSKKDTIEKEPDEKEDLKEKEPSDKEDKENRKQEEPNNKGHSQKEESSNKKPKKEDKNKKGRKLHKVKDKYAYEDYNTWYELYKKIIDGDYDK